MDLNFNQNHHIIERYLKLNMDAIEFLREHSDIVRLLAREGRLSELQLKLCKLLGILERGGND